MKGVWSHWLTHACRPSCPILAQGGQQGAFLLRMRLAWAHHGCKSRSPAESINSGLSCFARECQLQKLPLWKRTQPAGIGTCHRATRIRNLTAAALRLMQANCRNA